MGKRVILKLEGSLEQGFRVLLEIGVEGEPPFEEREGKLPSAADLAAQLQRWQQSYRQLSQLTRITFKAASTHLAPLGYGEQLENCRQTTNTLTQEFLRWLKSASFLDIDQRLRTVLHPDESIRILIRTRNRQLHHLPWHCWGFVEDYPQAEVAFGTSTINRRPLTSSPLAGDMRILAILGNSSGIDTTCDRRFLENLPNTIVEFLVEPSPTAIRKQLWEQRWHILFFAGHSQTEDNQGRIYINAQDSISIEDLKRGLKRSIAHGLKLAIFNSCDGLGLAYELEPLQLPQLIVMRQPVPDRVAQAFLKYWLNAYIQDQGPPFHLAVRQARERLQEEWEQDFPCAGWLPISFQHPVDPPPTWQELRRQPSSPATDSLATIETATVGSRGVASTSISVPRLEPRRWLHALRARELRVLVAISIVATLLVTGVRATGVLQPLELKAWDQMMVWRPAERPDPRILIVEITEADIQSQKQRNEPMQRISTSAQTKNQTVDISLSDQSLKRILDILLPYQPRVIGLDIYRDFPVQSDQPELAEHLRQQPVIGICKAEDYWDAGIPTIDPPPEIPTERIAFSDFQEDDDQVLRRQLLQMNPLKQRSTTRCEATQSFSAKIAFTYLQQQGITAEITPYDHVQLGNRVFPSLKFRQGGYQFLRAADKGVSQLLLNYRATPEPAISISMGELLDPATEINPEYIQDKIVLIGVTAPGNDFWSTPYGTAPDQQIPGVKIHAHMISQLISAVLDRRPLLWTWTRGIEFIWILGWSLLGSILIWQYSRNRNIKSLFISSSALLTLMFVCLSSLCFGGLMIGGWLPLIPSLTALIFAVAFSTLYRISKFTDLLNKFYDS